MTNILAICSALNNSYLALEYNNEIRSEIIKSDTNYHSLYLISKIKEITKNIQINSLDFITVNLGPGSFTGIRAALSIAKVLAGELNLPLVGLDTAQILLASFNKKILLMDARRDMYFIGKKEGLDYKIELIKKDNLDKNLNPELIVCDKRCSEIFKNSLCYEDIECDLGKTMLSLSKEKFKKTKDKSEFNYLKIQANYIQTPPVF